MKHLIITTIAAVLVVGCRPSAPDTIHRAASTGNIEAVKQHIAAGTDVNVKGGFLDVTPLHYAAIKGHKEIAELLIAEEPIYRKPFALYENCNCIATRDNCCQTISKCSIARKNIDASH